MKAAWIVEVIASHQLYLFMVTPKSWGYDETDMKTVENAMKEQGGILDFIILYIYASGYYRVTT